MATIKSEVQALTAGNTLATTGINSLVNAAYVELAELNHATNDPLDVLIDVQITCGVTTTNKQAVIFAIASLDGTNFTKKTTDAGFSSADEAEMYFVGTLPMNTASVAHRKIFSLAAAYGGVLPVKTKLVIKNDSGATFAASGHLVNAYEVWGVAV